MGCLSNWLHILRPTLTFVVRRLHVPAPIPQPPHPCLGTSIMSSTVISWHGANNIPIWPPDTWNLVNLKSPPTTGCANAGRKIIQMLSTPMECSTAKILLVSYSRYALTLQVQSSLCLLRPFHWLIAPTPWGAMLNRCGFVRPSVTLHNFMLQASDQR
jgi:hypothetical protein